MDSLTQLFNFCLVHKYKEKIGDPLKVVWGTETYRVYQKITLYHRLDMLVPSWFRRFALDKEAYLCDNQWVMFYGKDSWGSTYISYDGGIGATGTISESVIELAAAFALRQQENK